MVEAEKGAGGTGIKDGRPAALLILRVGGRGNIAGRGCGKSETDVLNVVEDGERDFLVDVAVRRGWF